MATEDPDPDGLSAYGVVASTPVREVGERLGGEHVCPEDSRLVDGTLQPQEVQRPDLVDERLEDVDEALVHGWLCPAHKPPLVLVRRARGPDVPRLSDDWTAAPIRLQDGRVMPVAVREADLPDDYVDDEISETDS